MALDPIAASLLEQIAAAGGPPIHELSIAEARELAAGFAAVAGDPEPVDKVREIVIPGPGGDIPATLITPKDAGRQPLGCLVYYHGGGWMLGDRAMLHPALTRVANRARCKVVSVAFRLAPEHKFPAPLDDCYAAFEWVAHNGAAIGVDAGRLAVGGDSSGGNLATAVALRARDENGPALAFQVLFYPVTVHDLDSASYRECGDRYNLTRSQMAWFWDHYLRDPADGDNPYASPLRAENLSGLPPAAVYTAEFDPLRDEGEAYARRLAEAGVAVVQRRFDGQIHGFLQVAMFPAAQSLIEDAAGHLKKALAH